MSSAALWKELKSVRAEYSDVQEELQTVRADRSRLKKKLDECEANKPPPLQHQRKALSTLSPSVAPSVSSAPTSEEWYQLASAVADTTNEEIILVEADVMFPSQSPITIDPGRSVSVVGRSENDGERVTFDGAAGSRFFVVDGGALYLTHLSLVNGSAPESNDACDDTSRDLLRCGGGAIAVLEDGQLIVPSCDIRGQGRRGGFIEAYNGGVQVLAYRTIVSFFNTTFEDLSASYGGAAVHISNIREGESGCIATFRHCRFLNGYSPPEGQICARHFDVSLYFYDCEFSDNEGIVLHLNMFPPSLLKIRGYTFLRNSGATESVDTGWEGPAIIASNGGVPYGIWDCYFHHNAGPVGGKG